MIGLQPTPQQTARALQASPHQSSFIISARTIELNITSRPMTHILRTRSLIMISTYATIVLFFRKRQVCYAQLPKLSRLSRSFLERTRDITLSDAPIPVGLVMLFSHLKSNLGV